MKSWDIIFWANEDAVDYIPTAWGNADRTSYKCPIGPRLTDQKKRSLINECANLLKGEFVWHRATCKRGNITSLEKAKALCKKGEYTSSLDTEEEIENSSDEDEEVSPDVPSKIIKKRKLNCLADVPITKSTNYQRPEFFQTLLKGPIHEMGPDDNRTVPEYQEHKEDNSITNCVTSTPPARARNFSVLSSSSSTPSASMGSTTSSTPSTLVENSCAQCGILAINMDLMKAEMNKKLDQIYSTLLTIAEGKTSDIGNNSVEKELPLKTIEAVQEFDSKIRDNLNFRKELITTLYVVGGPDVHKSTYNILKRLLTPQLTLQFSAVGKGNKASFTSLQLYSIIKDVLHRRFSETTDVEIMKSIVRFFASGKDRTKSLNK